MVSLSSQQPNEASNAGAAKRQPTGDYEVGWCRPPKHTRFKPGNKSCGGRRRGSLNVRTVFENVMAMKVPIRKGSKTVKVPAVQAMLESHTVKALQGDKASLGKVIELGAKLRYFAPQDDNAEPCAVAPSAPANARPSDKLIDSIDRARLDRQEQAELSRLAEVIDREGDVIALDEAPLLRLKQLIAKGRGKNDSTASGASVQETGQPVDPPGAPLDQAA